jgi:hypothetical protein
MHRIFYTTELKALMCRKWKMTSDSFVNGRRTESCQLRWKTTPVCFVNKRRPQFLFNGRQPQLFYQWRTTSIVLQMKDNLQYFCKWKTTSNILVNGRRPQIFL